MRETAPATATAVGEAAAPGPAAVTFTKRRLGAPTGLFAVEAAGLRWLAAAGGVPVVKPLSVSDEALVLPRLPEIAPTPEAAATFGRLLAITHDAGAPTFGSPPDGWRGDGYIGPLGLPHRPGEHWGAWFAEFRVLPYLRSARDAGNLNRDEAETIGHVLDRLADPESGLADPGEPARLHGDLWNGNVLWTEGGVMLIDPAAHGGHRETDLAMLTLFGLPHLDRVLDTYVEQHPLAEGWHERAGLHQLHPLLVHATRFGGGYGAHAAAIAHRFA